MLQKTRNCIIRFLVMGLSERVEQCGKRLRVCVWLCYGAGKIREWFTDTFAQTSASISSQVCCVLCAVCCVLCAVCCVLCAVCCVLCAGARHLLLCCLIHIALHCSLSG
jgi:hypothetical protein